MNEAVLLLHAGATLFMTGLIWFVQVVHYPLFASVGREAFVAYEAAHQNRTSLVVGPVMLVEALTTATILVSATGGPDFGLAVAGALLVVLIWLSTAFVQVPLHRSLEEGFSDGDARRLVASNWVRTAAWTARSGVALALV